MKLGTSEITSIIRHHLQEHEVKLETGEVGQVVSTGDGIVKVYGLEGAMAGELVEFPGHGALKGIVLNLEYDTVGIALLGSQREVVEGDMARRVGSLLRVPVGDNLSGRVVNALGEPVDDLGSLYAQIKRPVEAPAPGISERGPVNESLLTGIKVVDSLIPIGKGQRELILGDRHSGKTALAIDTIINQRNRNVHCVYVAIGQKLSSVAQIVARLRSHNAMAHTTVVVAGAADAAPLQVMAPYCGCAIAEYFRDRGEDALVVYDDLTRHATAWRQLSLLLRRPPGREAFPGDIFFLHSRLLERAARLSPRQGDGTLTALPLAETQSGDLSAYIPTNLISITDGQIYLDREMFNAGRRPAVNLGLSVSRVGGAAQSAAMRRLAGTLRLELAQHREMESFSRFSGELDPVTQRQLKRGARLQEILKQPQYQPVSEAHQLLLLLATTKGYLDPFPLEEVARFEEDLYHFMTRRYGDAISTLEQERKMGGEVEALLLKGLGEFQDEFSRAAQCPLPAPLSGGALPAYDSDSGAR